MRSKRLEKEYRENMEELKVVLKFLAAAITAVTVAIVGAIKLLW